MKNITGLILLLLFNLSILGESSVCELNTAILDDPCSLMSIKKEQIVEKKDQYQGLLELQESYLNSTRLKAYITKLDNPLENLEAKDKLTLELAKSLDEESYQKIRTGGSIGVLLVSSLLMAYNTKNVASKGLISRMISIINPSKNVFWTHMNTTMWLSSIFVGIHSGKKLYQTIQQRKEMEELIKNLDYFQDQSENLITFNEILEEIEVCYYSQREMLLEMKYIELEITPGGLEVCHNKRPNS